MKINSAGVAVVNLCNSYSYNYTVRTVVNIGASVMVSVINYILQLVLKRLAKFERFKTISGEVKGTVTKLFFAFFINIGILILLINANLQDTFVTIKTIADSLPTSLGAIFFNGKYSDMNRYWYTDVGVPIITLMLVNLFSNVFSAVIQCPIRCMKRCCCGTRQILQVDMNAYFEGPEFEISTYYAKNLAFLFVCMMYSGGIPILLPILFVYLLLKYWIDKCLVLRFFKAPPKYNIDIHN